MINNDFDPQFDAAGQYYNVDPALIKTIFHVESGGNPNAPRGASGEIGSMQMMPKTAQMLNVQDPTDMSQAIPAAAKYLRQGLDANNNDPVAAVRYYNGGPNGPNNPATMQYAQKAANLYGQMKINSGQTKSTQTDSSNKSSDPFLDAGEQILSGSNKTSSTSTNNDPYLAAGEKIIAGMGGGSTRTPVDLNAPDTTTEAQPSTLQNVLAGGAHGLMSVGNTIGTYLDKGAIAAGKYIPGIGDLGQSDLSARQDFENQYNQKYGDSTAANLANAGGQMLASGPLVAPIGAAGGAIAKGLSQAISNPLLRAAAPAATYLATGAAQGGAAAALTGGDPLTGAMAGGAASGLGLGALGVGSALGSSSFVSKAADNLVKHMSETAGGITGASLGSLLGMPGAVAGGMGGAAIGRYAGPILADIAKRYGSGMAMKAAAALNSNAGSTAAGVIGGKVNQLQQEQLPQGE
jgi:hypothetical protein